MSSRASLEHVYLSLVFKKLFLVGEQVSGHDLTVHCVHSFFILVEKFSKELTRRRFTNTCHGSKTKRKHIVHTHTTQQNVSKVDTDEREKTHTHQR